MEDEVGRPSQLEAKNEVENLNGIDYAVAVLLGELEIKQLKSWKSIIRKLYSHIKICLCYPKD